MDYQRIFDGIVVRINEEIINCVVFLGHGQGLDFRPCATGFLLEYDGAPYLVTARHVATELESIPFSVRVVTTTLGSAVFSIDLEQSKTKWDLFKWFHHRNPCADLSVLPFPIDAQEQRLRLGFLPSQFLMRNTSLHKDAGYGTMCHVIGLFSARSGAKRNMTVVHTGHIAVMADSGELIQSSHNGIASEVEGHLVSISNLAGLSGAPVMVRASPVADDDVNADLYSQRTPEDGLKLLGVWQGSWDTSADRQRVPVGMGIVTPGYRLFELLSYYEVSQNRRHFIHLERLAPEFD